MAYDAARRRVFVFGGFLGTSQVVNDTWTWDGGTWTQLLPKSSPPARTEHAMAYDARRQRIVLYGGDNRITGFKGTWEWDGSAWTQRHPTTSPPCMVWHAMAYDSARQCVVMFGYGGPNYPHTTWEWDGTNWALRLPKTKPPTLTDHAMVNDVARQRVVLFGGYFNQQYSSETWEWDGSNWTQRSPRVSPPARAGHTMIYHPVRRRVLMFGGWRGTQRFDDTWEWDGRTWAKQQSATKPPARGDHAMAFDDTRRRVVVFGGSRALALNDTWEYSAPHVVASGTPRPGSTMTFTLEAPGNAGRYYQLGSSLGAGPMPIDNRFIDLAPDHLLVASTSGNLPGIFSGYRGVIDGGGKASAALNIPNLAALIGTRVHSAFVTLDAKAPSGVWSISNTETVTVVK